MVIMCTTYFNVTFRNSCIFSYIVFMDFVLFSDRTAIVSINNIKHLIFIMVTGFVFFAVGIGYLNII
jgi:hypothetical protein